jgi:hypothetical protein
VPSIEAISTKLAIFVEYQDIIKFFKIWTISVWRFQL